MTDEPQNSKKSTNSKKSMNSLSCQPSLEELYAYMDGFIDDEQRTSIQSHLNACGGCGHLYEFHNELRHFVGSKCQSELPDGLQQRVFKAISDLGL